MIYSWMSPHVSAIACTAVIQDDFYSMLGVSEQIKLRKPQSTHNLYYGAVPFIDSE